MFGFGDNKTLVALWVYFQLIRESSIMSRYKETPSGKAEQERLYWERREYFTRHGYGDR